MFDWKLILVLLHEIHPGSKGGESLESSGCGGMVSNSMAPKQLGKGRVVY